MAAAEWREREDDEARPGAQALVPAKDAPSIELARAAWLHEKSGRSNSAKTKRAYTSTFDSFRAYLRAQWLDLDSDAALVQVAAQAWAATPRERDGAPVTNATHNQRLAIVSSFYVYARRHTFFKVLFQENPVEGMKRRPVEDYASAQPLEYAGVAEQLAAIDRTTLAGLRDYALLRLALQTGRRLSELAALRWGDVTLSDDRATVIWRHCKGGKVMHDELPKKVTTALLVWLRAVSDADLDSVPHEAPVFISLARNGTRGHALTLQAVADICEKRLGESKVHALRHTFAHAMEDAGATVSEIQARLGHGSLDVTGRYLARLRSAVNSKADTLEAMFDPEPTQEALRRDSGARITRPLGRSRSDQKGT